VVLLVFTGWLGGELVHRYRVGTIAAASTEPTTARAGRPPSGERRAGPRDRRMPAAA